MVLSSQDLDGITRSGRLALRLPLRTKQGRKEAAAAAASTAAPPPPPPFGELRITLSFGDPGASQGERAGWITLQITLCLQPS